MTVDLLINIATSLKPSFSITSLIIFGLLLLCVWLLPLHIWSRDNASPVLRYKPSALVRYMLLKCPHMTNTNVISHIWTSGHVQTIMCHVSPAMPERGYKRQYIQMNDRGIVALDFYMGSKLDKKSTLLLIIPTILGSLSSLAGLCQIACERGLRPVVFNRRGQSESYCSTPRLQVIGDHADLRQVVNYLSSKYSASTIVAVSLGLGSGLLLSYLGEYGSSSRINAACCISPVFDYRAVYREMAQPYKWILLQRLKAIIFKHSNFYDDKTLREILNCDDLLNYDRLVSGKFDQYSLDEYWEMMNPLRDVDDISCPMLFIAAADDPICDVTKIPDDLFTDVPNFILCLNEYGGHCGFRNGWNIARRNGIVDKSTNAHVNNIGLVMSTTRSWAEELSVDYLITIRRFLRWESKINRHFYVTKLK